MDAQMNGETVQSSLPVWDFVVDTVNMLVPMLTGLLEAQQQSEVAATLILGTIPGLPNAGVDWPGFISGTVVFAGLDSQIRSMMSKSGHPDYYPVYDLVNGLLSVKATHNPAAT
jgi:hypothetical protein